MHDRSVAYMLTMLQTNIRIHQNFLIPKILSYGKESKALTCSVLCTKDAKYCRFWDVLVPLNG